MRCLWLGLGQLGGRSSEGGRSVLKVCAVVFMLSAFGTAGRALAQENPLGNVKTNVPAPAEAPKDRASHRAQPQRQLLR